MQKFKNIKKLLFEFKRGEELSIPTDNLRTVKIDGDSDGANGSGNSEAMTDILSMTQKELVEFVLPTGVQMPPSYDNEIVYDSSNFSIPDAYLVDSEILASYVPSEAETPSIEPFYVTSVKQVREKYPYLGQLIASQMIQDEPELSPEEIEHNILSVYTEVFREVSNPSTSATERRELFRENPSSYCIANAALDGGLYVEMVDASSSGNTGSREQIIVEGETFWRFKAGEIG